MGQNKANFPLKKFVGKDRKFLIFRAGVGQVVFSNLLLLNKNSMEENHVVLGWKWLKKRNFFED